MLSERGISVDQSTVYRWLQKLGPELTKRTEGIVNLPDLGEKEPHTLGHTAFNSHVMSSQMP